MHGGGCVGRQRQVPWAARRPGLACWSTVTVSAVPGKGGLEPYHSTPAGGGLLGEVGA